MEKVTITVLAEKLNTTPATISRALNNHPAISDSMKKKVHALAEKMNYKRNKIASSLRSGKTYTIGVLIPSANISFFGSVVHGIEIVANANGYNILLYQTNESRKFEGKGVEALLSAHVDGILISVSKETKDYTHLSNAKKLGVPIVFFDRAKEGLGISSVVIDDYKGAFMATEHLIKQGYKRIAHISGPLHMKVFNDRMEGYKAAMQQYKMKFSDDWLFEGDVSIESGKAAIGHFLSLKEKPDAVFAVEDYSALGALKELKNRKVAVPERFGVFGFANELFAEHLTPSLSSVDQQTILMGKEAMQLLLSLMANKKQPAACTNITLDPLLIFRESSQRKIK
ncbi:MAG TPA: LacI family DNA-binding transcriptional regulator [Arachidicoccus soli]|uniref:LacI family transcriptional regulator n=1 Tax=Arachidicoccus soli TaxID=2341117 RepID=A0A386HLK3_9BACT|nr:LacI family DNA-binding transcriptional regulator [Arachidicoccus soli]AYD46777.1 LacI family transcriptional regulator [Arachidicoccus soli]HEU0227892.1 LacI family DNA-binding transcriptional regulator [Arachidicoccus soli]